MTDPKSEKPQLSLAQLLSEEEKTHAEVTRIRAESKALADLTKTLEELAQEEGSDTPPSSETRA